MNQLLRGYAFSASYKATHTHTAAYGGGKETILQTRFGELASQNAREAPGMATLAWERLQTGPSDNIRTGADAKNRRLLLLRLYTIFFNMGGHATPP